MGVYLPLPSEYQEVEYIQSSGTQYIDTGLPPSNNTKVQFKLSNYSINSSIQYVFGSTSRRGNNMFGLLGTTSWSGDTINGHLLYGTSEYKLSSGNIGNGGTHTGELSSNGFYVDGTRIRTVSGTFTGTLNMTIFAGNINGIIGANEKGSFKLYYFKVYESGTLVRDFVPCYKTSNNEIGLFDKVENKFYANSGTGTFTKGNDVKLFQPELKNAYIGEVYEYSYDFRNKTVALMQADGWNMFWNSSYVIFNSNGLNTRNKDYSVMAKIENLNNTIKNSKKITLSFTGSLTNTFGGRLSLYNVATSSSRSGVTGPFASNGNTQIQTTIYGTNTTDSRTVNSTMTVTTVLDFTAKTWNTTATDGYSRSGTLTDTQISNIKNNSNGFYISAGITGSNTSGGLTSIYVKIE